MRRKYTPPKINLQIIDLEQGIATSSCKGAYQGNGHGNGKGCKAWMIDDYEMPEKDDLFLHIQ